MLVSHEDANLPGPRSGLRRGAPRLQEGRGGRRDCDLSDVWRHFQPAWARPGAGAGAGAGTGAGTANTGCPTGVQVTESDTLPLEDSGTCGGACKGTEVGGGPGRAAWWGPTGRPPSLRNTAEGGPGRASWGHKRPPTCQGCAWAHHACRYAGVGYGAASSHRVGIMCIVRPAVRLDQRK